MCRVCQPGGRVAVLEFSTPPNWPWRPVYGWYFRHVLPRIGQSLARNDHSAYAYLPQSVGQFPEGQALAEKLSEAGLTQVRFFPTDFRSRHTLRGHQAGQAACARHRRPTGCPPLTGCQHARSHSQYGRAPTPWSPVVGSAASAMSLSIPPVWRCRWRDRPLPGCDHSRTVQAALGQSSGRHDPGRAGDRRLRRR